MFVNKLLFIRKLENRIFQRVRIFIRQGSGSEEKVSTYEKEANKLPNRTPKNTRIFFPNLFQTTRDHCRKEDST